MSILPDCSKRLYNLCLCVFIALIAGCSSHDPVIPDTIPDPLPDSPDDPSSLLCNPFINNGYADKLSYFPGDKMKLFFDSKGKTDLCTLTIYTVTGDSVFSIPASLPLTPQVPADASEHGFDFPVALEVSVPELQSGIYLVEKRIPFIVKTRDIVDLMVIYPSNTTNAYALSGGKSLYSTEGRPGAVSFHRPIPLAALSEVCLKWFTTLSEFSMGYIADIDMDSYEHISNAKVIVIPGHSEYWTRQARLNFDKFVDSGGDALILSGNTMWWQVRYSDDGSQLICYKDGGLDPSQDVLLKTINWHEPSLDYPILSSIGAHFPLGGYGRRVDNGWNGYKIATPNSPLFEGLNAERGDIIAVSSLEYDGAPIIAYDEEGYPILDAETLGFEQIELLGYDKGFRVTETTATFIAFRKKSTSGVVVNTATTDWCSVEGMGGKSGNAIKAITYNALHKLVNDATVFSK